MSRRGSPDRNQREQRARQDPELVSPSQSRNFPELRGEGKRLAVVDHERRYVAERRYGQAEQRDICQHLEVARIPGEEDQRRDDDGADECAALRARARLPKGVREKERNDGPEVRTDQEQVPGQHGTEEASRGRVTRHEHKETDRQAERGECRVALV